MKIKRIFLVGIVLVSLISIGGFYFEIYKIQNLDIKNDKEYEAVVTIDETKKIMRLEFISSK